MAKSVKKEENKFYKTGVLKVILTRELLENGNIQTKFTASADRLSVVDLRNIGKSLLDQSNEIEIKESMENSLKKLMHETKT